MRSPWHRRHDRDQENVNADQALEISREQRDRAVRQRVEFERLASWMREIREVNHLAERFDEAFRGGDGR